MNTLQIFHLLRMFLLFIFHSLKVLVHHLMINLYIPHLKVGGPFVYVCVHILDMVCWHLNRPHEILHYRLHTKISYYEINNGMKFEELSYN